MKKVLSILLVAMIMFGLAGCTTSGGSGTESQADVPGLNTDINSLGIMDNMSIYANDDPYSIKYLYLTVRKGSAADKADYTFKEVDAVNIYSTEDKFAEVLVQEGDVNGPKLGLFGFGQTTTNAMISVRGKTSRSASAQKSYKIKLFNNAGLWNMQSTIAINKHPFDSTRLRNLLCFNLMQGIPNLTSLRTQFFRVYIKDETESADTSFVDYGFFTQVESVTKRYLRNHGLDGEGQLYKAQNFEFYEHPDLKLVTDPTYDLAKFNEVLEIKGNNEDHTKLLTMLKDVNAGVMTIDEIIDKYFDRSNYLTWMAVNIVLGNIDVINQNFYLYSPLNSSKWYFIPWDYDETFIRKEYADIQKGTPSWQTGLSNFWPSLLHSKFLKVEKNRNDLIAKVNELMKQITPERVKTALDKLAPLVKPQVFALPDLEKNGVTPERYDELIASMPNEILINYDLFLKSLQAPQPMYINQPVKQDDGVLFSWGDAYDFQNQPITYTVEISNDYNFSSTIYKMENLNKTSTKFPALTPGKYYCRVSATDTDGNSQYAFDFYEDIEARMHAGVYEFTWQ